MYPVVVYIMNQVACQQTLKKANHSMVKSSYSLKQLWPKHSHRFQVSWPQSRWPECHASTHKTQTKFCTTWWTSGTELSNVIKTMANWWCGFQPCLRCWATEKLVIHAQHAHVHYKWRDSTITIQTRRGKSGSASQAVSSSWELMGVLFPVSPLKKCLDMGLIVVRPSKSIKKPTVSRHVLVCGHFLSANDVTSSAFGCTVVITIQIYSTC